MNMLIIVIINIREKGSFLLTFTKSQREITISFPNGKSQGPLGKILSMSISRNGVFHSILIEYESLCFCELRTRHEYVHRERVHSYKATLCSSYSSPEGTNQK